MDAEQMVEMMCDGDALNRLVEGTELASMISQAAPSQREGVRASLNLVADALRLLKTKEEANDNMDGARVGDEATGLDFSDQHAGAARAAATAAQSVARSAGAAADEHRRQARRARCGSCSMSWPACRSCRSLSTALTENRKSNNPVVIGLQGKAQMETIYGHLAEAMLSQPWTKIFLKTSEPRAAKWVSDAIGEQDREWLRESRTTPRDGRAIEQGRETQDVSSSKSEPFRWCCRRKSAGCPRCTGI